MNWYSTIKTSGHINKIDEISLFIVKVLIKKILMNSKTFIIDYKNLGSEYLKYIGKINVVFHTVINPEYKDSFDIEGTSYIDADEDGYIQSTLIVGSFPIKKQLLKDIRNKLIETIRHELEHCLKEQKELPVNDISDKDENDLLNWRNYFLNAAEIPAMVNGVYLKAKKSRIAFTKYINDYLNNWMNWYVSKHKGINIGDVINLKNEIITKWIDFAKSKNYKII